MNTEANKMRETATVTNGVGEVVATYTPAKGYMSSVGTIPPAVLDALALAAFGHTRVCVYVPRGGQTTECPRPDVFVTAARFRLIPGKEIAPNHIDYTDADSGVWFGWQGTSDFS